MECVESLRQSIPSIEAEYHIIVVDNHSPDNSYTLLHDSLPKEVILLESCRNAGYAYGNNLGIKYAIEHGAEYICILNNDTIITEDFLTPCLQQLEKNPQIAFLGPMLMNYDNNLVQNTGGRFSILTGKSRSLNKDVPVSEIKEDIIQCDFVVGAALLFRSSLVQNIGLIPEEYFLFYEETEWCYKAKQAGFVNCVYTKAKVIHKGSESLKTMSKMQRYLMERNRTLFIKRNGTSLQVVFFSVYNFGRLLFRAVFQRIPFFQYLRYQHDGYIERFDPRYVKIKEE